MGYRVGSKGQVVIDKEIRDTLDIQPGWIAIQLLVDNYVEIRFCPPEHTESLLGALAPYSDVRLPDQEALSTAREWARAQAAIERSRHKANTDE